MEDDGNPGSELVLALRDLGFVVKIQFDQTEGVVNSVDSRRHVGNNGKLRNVRICR
jgi:hypothetical protein